MVGITARVGEKGQVVIPKSVRDHLGIAPDTELVVDVEEEKVVMTKKRSGMKVLEEFINAFPKRKLPKHIDWNKEHYSQYE